MYANRKAIEKRKPLLKHRRLDAVTKDYLELTDALLQLEEEDNG